MLTKKSGKASTLIDVQAVDNSSNSSGRKGSQASDSKISADLLTPVSKRKPGKLNRKSSLREFEDKVKEIAFN